jgi:hypothetical protein
MSQRSVIRTGQVLAVTQAGSPTFRYAPSTYSILFGVVEEAIVMLSGIPPAG